MSNGIASGVPPADGIAGGVAGAGACASACEEMVTAASAASAKEIVERISTLLVEVSFQGFFDVRRLHRRRQSVLAVGDARRLPGAVGTFLRGADEDLDAGLEVGLVADLVGDDLGLRR